MLPRELPESRVLCFGYESQWLGKKAIRQRLPTVTTSLLRCLMEKRKVLLSRTLDIKPPNVVSDMFTAALSLYWSLLWGTGG